MKTKHMAIWLPLLAVVNICFTYHFVSSNCIYFVVIILSMGVCVSLSGLVEQFPIGVPTVQFYAKILELV